MDGFGAYKAGQLDCWSLYNFFFFRCAYVDNDGGIVV